MEDLMKKTALFLCLLLTVLTFAACKASGDSTETSGLSFDDYLASVSQAIADGSYKFPSETGIDIDPPTEPKLTFKVYDNYAEVTGWEYVVSKFELPAEYSGKPVTKIAKSAFEGCILLEEIVLPSSLTDIGESAFLGCVSLKTINIPDNVTTVGEYAFYGCPALESVTIGSGVTQIGVGAFGKCQSLGEISVNSSNGSYSSSDGVLFNKSGDTLVCYPAGRSGENYSIPAGVKTLSDYAFIFNQNLKTISMTDSVFSLGNGTFESSAKLESVTLSSSLKYIGHATFKDCTKLSSIVIPEGVVSIGYTDDRIDRGGSFSGCTSLKSISIPATLKRIYDDSFENCTSLTEVLYAGNADAWNTITVGENNQPLWLAAKVYK